MTVQAEHELPGEPMDLALRASSDGYMTLGDGRIVRFALDEATGGLDLTVAASGLDSPRGLAILGDAPIVADLGPLPCPESYPCKGENVDAGSVEEGERRILRESNGRLLRSDIGRDGTLANRRIILDRLPVANTDHGVNAVTPGPGGRVSVAIGNLDDGRLYGIDNDGGTRTGWRRKEVLEIQEGASYGHPFDGTFAPYTRRTAGPLWLLDTAGSAASSGSAGEGARRSSWGVATTSTRSSSHKQGEPSR